MSSARQVPVTQDHIDRLQSGTSGQGGFQSFCQQLLDNISNGVLTISEEMAKKGDRYASKYGPGGWEDLFQDLGFDVP